MTRIDELTKTKERLESMAELARSAKRGAVLSRLRRAKLDAVERACLELVIDIDEELERRGIAA